MPSVIEGAAKNWKTTAAGLVVVLSGVVAALKLVSGEMTPGEAWPLITAAIAGLGLIFASDETTTPTPPPQD